MTLFAVPPRPQHSGSLIHLHDPDKKWKSHTSWGPVLHENRGLCGAGVIFTENRESMKPLPEAVDWAGNVLRVDGLPTVALSWCAICLGRAISQHNDLAISMIRELARRQQEG